MKIFLLIRKKSPTGNNLFPQSSSMQRGGGYDPGAGQGQNYMLTQQNDDALNTLHVCHVPLKILSEHGLSSQSLSSI